MHKKAEIVDLRFDLYGTKPRDIAIGDQQTLWVTCTANVEIARLSQDGTVEHFPVDAKPERIAVGGENVWFTMPIIESVGRVDRAGAIQVYKLPRGSRPAGIATSGDDGWVTLAGTGELAKVSIDGTIHIVQPVVMGDDELVNPAPAEPRYAAVDDRGSVWFTRSGRADIVRMDADETTESWTEEECVEPAAIAADREAVWIADHTGGGIWRIGLAEKLLQRVEPWPTSEASEIASDGRGGCWFSEPDDDLVGHIDVDAKLTEYDISSYGTRPGGVAVDRDGVAWFALWSGGIIGIAPEERDGQYRIE